MAGPESGRCRWLATYASHRMVVSRLQRRPVRRLRWRGKTGILRAFYFLRRFQEGDAIEMLTAAPMASGMTERTVDTTVTRAIEAAPRAALVGVSIRER
jgi:hypothetical protein